VIDRPIALAAAGLVIAGQHGDPFEKRGFADAVLASDDRDWSLETQFETVVQERKAEWIGGAIGDARWIEPDAPEIGRRHIDGSISS
jgi:hypothetical protein